MEAGLGPFAPDHGATDRVVLSGCGIAALAVGLTLVRPVIDVAGGAPVGWSRMPALAAAAVAIVVLLYGQYRVVALAHAGHGLARVGIFVATASGLTAFIYTAVADGQIQLGKFFRVYFDREIISLTWVDLLRGAVNTIVAAFMAEGLAIVLGLIVATFVLSPRRRAHLPAVVYVDVIRGLPLVVLTLLVYQGLTYIGIRLSAFVAIVMTLTLNASAYIAEIFRAGIQSVPRGQMDAARSLGMPHTMAMLFVVIPQAVRAVIPPLMSEFIALVKDTALVYILVGATVGSADLFTRARTAVASTFSVTPYILASAIYLAITVPLTRVVGRLERRLRAGLA